MTGSRPLVLSESGLQEHSNGSRVLLSVLSVAQGFSECMSWAQHPTHKLIGRHGNGRLDSQAACAHKCTCQRAPNDHAAMHHHHRPATIGHMSSCYVQAPRMAHASLYSTTTVDSIYGGLHLFNRRERKEACRVHVPAPLWMQYDLHTNLR